MWCSNLDHGVARTAQKDELQAWLMSEVCRLAEADAAAAAAVGTGGAGGGHVSSKAGQVVRASLCFSIAIAVKRGWLEKPADQRAALLQVRCLMARHITCCLDASLRWPFGSQLLRLQPQHAVTTEQKLCTDVMDAKGSEVK